MAERRVLRRWTEQDLDGLRRLYRTMTPLEVAKKLRRPVSSVRQKAVRLGLSEKRAEDWSQAEDDYLREHYQETSTKRIAVTLGRTRMAVALRAGKLGLKKSAAGAYDTRRDGANFGCPKAASTSATDLAYIAGVFDGEGCVGANTRNHDRPVVRLFIVNTHRGLIEWIQATLGGKMAVEPVSGRRRKTCYVWYTSNVDATKDVTRAILPYLKVKKEQAELALQWEPGMPFAGGLELVRKIQILNGRKTE